MENDRFAHFVESQETKWRQQEVVESVFILGKDERDLSDITCAVYLAVGDVQLRVSFVGNGMFQVVLPHEMKERITTLGYVVFGGKIFSVVPGFGGLDWSGGCPEYYWVRLVGMPYAWWTPESFVEAVGSFGKLAGVCENTAFNRDLRWARLLVEVPHRSVIPERRPFLISKDDRRDGSGYIYYVVEDDIYVSSWYDSIRSQPLLCWDKDDQSKVEKILHSVKGRVYRRGHGNCAASSSSA